MLLFQVSYITAKDYPGTDEAVTAYTKGEEANWQEKKHLRVEEKADDKGKKNS